MDISFENKKVKLNIFNATQGPSKDKDYFIIDLIDIIQESVEESLTLILTKDPIFTCLVYFDIDEFKCDSYTREVNTLLDSPNSSNLSPWTIRYERLLDLAKESMLIFIQSLL